MDANEIVPGGFSQIKVIKAEKAVRRAIEGLVQLLGDEDDVVVSEAGRALAGLGTRAVVEALAAALPRARSPRLRRMIVLALQAHAPVEWSSVTLALIEAGKRGRDPGVAGLIRAALAYLMPTEHVISRPPSIPGGRPICRRHSPRSAVADERPRHVGDPNPAPPSTGPRPLKPRSNSDEETPRRGRRVSA